ncbi:hypothetical protein G6F65_015736 [Rhizopus arrhizus]|nr:hypothetical protein G6F65_015736 [Rhizopus arrhizus]
MGAAGEGGFGAQRIDAGIDAGFLAMDLFSRVSGAGSRASPRAASWKKHAYHRSRPGDAGGRCRQRLPGSRPAVLVAAATGADRPGRGDRRGVQPRPRAGAGSVLPAVPAAAAVPRWLAHSQAGPVPRQGRDPRTGVRPGGVHRHRRRVPDPLADPGDAAGGVLRAGGDRVAHRSGGGRCDRLQGADSQAPDAHPGRRVAAQRCVRPGLLPLRGGGGDDRHVLAGHRLADLRVGGGGRPGSGRCGHPGRIDLPALAVAPLRRRAGRGDAGQPADPLRRLPAGRRDPGVGHPRRGRRRYRDELRRADRAASTA